MPHTPPVRGVLGQTRTRALWSIAACAFLTAGCVGAIIEPDPSANEDPTNADPTNPDPTNPAPTDPEVLTGLEHWTAQCSTCHGVFVGDGGISTGNNNGDFRLDAASTIAQHGDGLAAYINDTMPKQSPSTCQGTCADSTAAYIRSRERTVATLECSQPNDLVYGIRELKLLTSLEYQRSLEDLLGVDTEFGASLANSDTTLGGFLNMRGRGLNGTTLESYKNNAEAIATWAAANQRPFACTDAAACGQRFVDEFLPRAFRGPVPDEQRQLYLALFQSYPDSGMQLALEAALTSPLFLYRIETGVDLQTAIDRGYYTNTSDSGPPAGDPVETIFAASFPPGSGRLDGDAWFFAENGAVEVTFSTPFTASVVIEVEARGTNYGDIWPELTVRVGGTQIGVQTVDDPVMKTYRFEVTGQTGTPSVRLEFNNDAGTPPFGAGQDANLYLARVSLVVPSATPPPPSDPAPTENPLAGVDASAFVLTPYELASTLSFMLTGSTPDAALLAAAQADQLTTEAQLRAQVTRLIDSPRGRQHIGEFVSQWFELDKVKSASRPEVPDFTPEVKESMVREVQEHFFHVFYDDAVPFSEFFGGDYTFLNRALADFYGVAGNFGDAFVQTEVPGRGGPIASGAFMAGHAHVERTAPILRAVHTRQNALCHYIDPPNSPIAGDNIDAQRAAAQMRVEEREQQEGALSSRDFYYLYTDEIDACAGCHEQIINPMFGMEDFDNVGRLRPSAGADSVIETIGGTQKTVSLSGTLYGVDSTSDEATITFAGAKDLSNKIASTTAVKTCLVRRSFRFLTGLAFYDRDVDLANRETLTDEQRDAYNCSASRMMAALERNQSPRDMFIELATESLLRLRR